VPPETRYAQVGRDRLAYQVLGQDRPTWCSPWAASAMALFFAGTRPERTSALIPAGRAPGRPAGQDHRGRDPGHLRRPRPRDRLRGHAAGRTAWHRNPDPGGLHAGEVELRGDGSCTGWSAGRGRGNGWVTWFGPMSGWGSSAASATAWSTSRQVRPAASRAGRDAGARRLLLVTGRTRTRPVCLRGRGRVPGAAGRLRGGLGHRLLKLLEGDPAGDGVLPPSPAKDPDAYRRFVDRRVRHCAGRVHHWQCRPGDRGPGRPVRADGRPASAAADVHAGLPHGAGGQAPPDQLPRAGHARPAGAVGRVRRTVCWSLAPDIPSYSNPLSIRACCRQARPDGPRGRRAAPPVAFDWPWPSARRSPSTPWARRNQPGCSMAA
jgi:hypothetical protein